MWNKIFSKNKRKEQSGPRVLKVNTDHNIIDWSPLINTNRKLWDRSKKRASSGPDILIATTVGGSSALSFVESLLAVAFTLRGARVHTLLCDRVLPACFRAEKTEVPDPAIFRRYKFNSHRLCQDCPEIGRYIYEPLALINHELSDFLNDSDKAQARKISHETPFSEIKNYQIGDENIGEHAYAGALRYFASGNLNNEPEGEMVVRRYFEGALLTNYALDKLLDKYDFRVACFHHGIYSPQGIIGEVCRSRGVRVVNWNPAYRKNCFIFSHGDTYHHTLLSEPVDVWENMPWNEAMERDIMEYLKSRWQGSRDWIWFHDKPDEEIDKIFREMNIDTSKPIVGMLTNVMWDAQLHYRANAFPDMLTWVLETIRYFSKRTDLQLLIRIHPAEIRGLVSRQPLLPEILKVFPELPKNIFIIPPDNSTSTYAAMMRCDSVIIYGTKTGVELTSIGVPVIVGGEAWIRNKGITIDASSRKEYFGHIDKLPLKQKLNPGILERARKYAYHFFFRRMIQIRFMKPSEGWPPYKVDISRLDELLPGADPGLDVICDGILNGSPFIYPAERLGIDG